MNIFVFFFHFFRKNVFLSFYFFLVFESAYSQDWTDSFNKRMHLLKRDGHGMHVLRRAPVFNSALANYPYQFEEAKRSGMHVL